MSRSAAPATPALPHEESATRIVVARPLLPSAQHITPYLQRIDDARHYSNFGPLVTELEDRLAARVSGTSACTVVNATQGLALLLKILAPKGGLCITPAFTFVATGHAAMEAGLTPLLVDVDPQSWMLTPRAAHEAIAQANGEVAAVIVVAAFGALPDIAGFERLQLETGVPVIIDAAAAFDSLRRCSLPAVVSLHATKVMGAGEGGYVVSPHAKILASLRSLTSFGFEGARRAMRPATNAKMSEYTAAIGLAALDGWPAARLRWMLAGRKLSLAASRSGVSPQRGWGEHWISSTCVVRTGDNGAAALAEKLDAAGVDSRAWWGGGLHHEPAFKDCPRGDLPVTEHLAASTLGLPFYMDMGDEEIAAIGRALEDAR